MRAKCTSFLCPRCRSFVVSNVNLACQIESDVSSLDYTEEVGLSRDNNNKCFGEFELRIVSLFSHEFKMGMSNQKVSNILILDNFYTLEC